ncbi:MAG: type I DNA topoisomerase [Anaeroplasmataceae bacterium]
MKNVIIVESPSKSKTIEQYMGSDYKVLSSVGHIRDLATTGPDGLGIDIENGFIPNYTIIKGKEKIVKDLKKECSGKKVFLATDPDREGEAISFHLAEILGLDKSELNRVEFHEITKPAILEAFENPRKIDMNLVYSQESRRMLDRIIGFKVSKLLQSRIKSQSAGRVQSVALKLIVDLEQEIKNFISTPYYELSAIIDGNKLQLESYNGLKDRIVSKELANEIYSSLSKEFIVSDIELKKQKRESKPAFTTSTMQQDASNKLGFTSSKTMSIAQRLYEGKQIGNQTVGLITYMRTDSTHLSVLFQNSAREYITNNYGKEYLGVAKEKKQALAQQAHEAIRPTSLERTPESIKAYLTSDEYKLYKLIYTRALTSLMAPAVFDRKKVTFKNNKTLWKMNGQVMTFDGYTKVYGNDEDDANHILPDFKLGEAYVASEIVLEELFTKPKSRYTEASLIKDMEELGIGRPSTYAQTMSTLKDRKYIEVIDKKLVPTEQGILTTKTLDDFFSPIINVKYTANMELELDKVAKGEIDSKVSLREFYDDFIPLFLNAKSNMEAIYPKPTDEICPNCGKMLVIRKGKYGEFISCSNYPECKYIKPSDNQKQEETEITDVLCPKCNTGYFVKRISQKGRNKGSYFYACNNFPKCKNIVNDEPTNERCPKCKAMMLKNSEGLYCSNSCDKLDSDYESVLCPNCKKGHLVRKIASKGKNKGNYFYACDNFPRCKTIYNDKPTNNICPKCGAIMFEVNGEIVCLNKDCNKNE